MSFYLAFLGTSLGLLAGYYGGALDTLIVRFIDIMLAIPNLLLTIVVVSILEPSLTNATLAIAVVSIPSYVRLTRAAVLNEKTEIMSPLHEWREQAYYV